MSILLDASLEESTVVIGDELITNGDFSAWSGAADPNNAPTGWSVVDNVATRYFHNATNAAQAISDGATTPGLRLYKTSFATIGLAYQFTIDVTSRVSGFVRPSLGGTHKMLADSVGTWSAIGRQSISTTLYLYGGVTTPTNITFTNFSVKEYYLADYSGNARHLSPANQPTWKTLSSGLKVMNFNGTTDLLDTGSDFIGTNAVTVECWVRPETAGENSAGHIICNGKLVIALDNTNGRISVTSNGGTTTVYSGTGAWAANTWTHLVVTWTAAGLVNIYVNGYLSGSADQDSGTPEAGSTNVFIGNRSAADRTFDGDISGCYMEDAIATPTDIRNWFYASLPYYATGTLTEQAASGELSFGAALSTAFIMGVQLGGSLSFAGKVAVTNPAWHLMDAALLWQGEWAADHMYDLNDVVLYRTDGASEWHVFVSKASHNTGNTPTTSAPWWRRLYQEKWL